MNNIKMKRINSRTFSLEINRENCGFLSQNSKELYIIGIGITDYTVHRNCESISDFYKNEYNFYKDWEIKKFHNYHAFESDLKHICEDIIWKDEIEYKGNVLKITRAYIGVHGITELYVEEGRRSVSKLKYIGKDFREVNEKLKFIIEVKQL